MSEFIDSSLARQFDRLPPFSLEAEMCLIASLMLSGQDMQTFDDLRIMVRRDDFFQADHQILFDACVAVREKCGALDPLLVRENLIERHLLEEVGGIAYLTEILSTVPSAAHGRHYAAIVREKAAIRAAIEVANGILRDAYAPHDGDRSDKICNDAAMKLARIAGTGRADDVIWMSEIAPEVYERKEGKTSYKLETGMSDLDEMIGGVPLGGYTIIGGSPGMGKSLLGKRMIAHIAGQGHKCGIVSIEESRHKIGTNLISADSGIPNNVLTYRGLTNEQWRSFAESVARVGKLPIAIIDTIDEIDAIESAVTALKIRHGCEVVFIDHFHLIRTDGRGNETEKQTLMSRKLKMAFKRTGVAGIVASQLNKPVDEDRRPTERDLRGSGSLWADADIILLLYRADHYKKNQPGFAPDNVLEVHVSKNKDGQNGMVRLSFDGDHQAVHNVSEAFI